MHASRKNLTSYGLYIHQFSRLRMGTFLRERRVEWVEGKTARKIAFLHIPKTAGSSAREYLQACIGSAKSGKSAKLHEWDPSIPLSDDAVDRARTARFISGHFSWTAMERLRLPENTYMFTVLRDPRDRIRSQYFYMRNHPKRIIPEGLKEIYQAAAELPPEEFFQLDDHRLEYMTNNFMVRQIAGALRETISSEDDWKDVLERAKSNLTKFDRVCSTETFDTDFSRVLADVELPRVLPLRRQNETSALIKNQNEREIALRRFGEEVNRVVDPFIKHDWQLYQFARDELGVALGTELGG